MSTSTSLCCCNYSTTSTLRSSTCSSSSSSAAASSPNNRPQLSPITTISKKNELKCSVISSHSNPKLIKSNLRSSFGQPLSPYHSPDNNNDDCDDDDVNFCYPFSSFIS